jgi:NAD(P)H-hydrate epimerase
MLEEMNADDIAALMPSRPKDGHKGSFGHLFVLSGSRGFTGAARLVCESAYRSGVGLVTLGIPKPLADILAASLREAMTLALPSTETESLSHAGLAHALVFAQGRDAVALGPGLSLHPETVHFAREMVEQCTVPMVVDADGLNALAVGGPFRGFGADAPAGPRVFTPHPGEMARLTGLSAADINHARAKTAMASAAAWNTVVVLKGHGTIVAAPDGRAACCPTGGSGLAKGGSGDVLTGIIGSLLAQGMNAFDAARLGVYAHGLAGDHAARRMTPRGMIAGDVIEALPAAWRELEG